jgi:Ras-related protein Rab-1A
MTINKISRDYDYLVKCLIIGDGGTGKSALIIKFADDVFKTEYTSTIGVDFKICTIKHRNKVLKLQIWDTAGQERFRAITTSYYRGSRVIIVCYDTTDINTFNNVDKWLDEINKHASKSVILVLSATKSDLTMDRQVSEYEGQEYAKSKNMLFIETSAKLGYNISELFRLISSSVIDKHVFDDEDITVYSNKKTMSNIAIQSQPSSNKAFCNC